MSVRSPDALGQGDRAALPPAEYLLVMARAFGMLFVLAAALSVVIASALLDPSWGEGVRLAGRADAEVAAEAAGAVPRYVAPLPSPLTRGAFTPWRVGIQAGHWRIGDLPDEQYRLRGDTGAQWRSISEADVNLRIASDVADMLRRSGVAVDLLPATVPPGYDADAFVAIHADDGGGGSASGWKVSAPWRASVASRRLSASISLWYGRLSGLAEDRYGVTYNMRGYYGFSWNRFSHAVSPSTPAAIIETGFLTSADDRRVIVEDPDRAGRAIAWGVLSYLGERVTMRPRDLVPLSYGPMEVVADGALLRYLPEANERVAARLPAGTRVRPVNEQGGWIELIVWGNYRVFGWMPREDLREVPG